MATADDHDTIARARLTALADKLEEAKLAIAAAVDGTALPYGRRSRHRCRTGDE